MKKHLLTGLVILLPIALTLMIILFLVDFFTTPFTSIVTSIFETELKSRSIFKFLRRLSSPFLVFSV